MLRKIYLHVVSICQSINLYNIKNPLDVNLGKLFYFVGDDLSPMLLKFQLWTFQIHTVHCSDSSFFSVPSFFRSRM